MRHISLATALALTVAMFALTPAKAELNGPKQNEQGMCKQRAANDHNGNFFYWAACPKPAAASAAPAKHHRHRG